MYYQQSSKYIIKTIIDSLKANPNRTFVEVEMYFIHRFWKDATLEQKNTMIQLISKFIIIYIYIRGQLEIISGGWVSSDEATTYYDDIIHQFTFGQKWAYSIFNVLPKVAWHLDQFGHSAGQASIISQMGFDALFMTRIDVDVYIYIYNIYIYIYLGEDKKE